MPEHKLILPLFDVGIEWEFLVSNRGYSGPLIIENASKVMAERLGFSIDQNQRNGGRLHIEEGLSLRTDGTAMEGHWFVPSNEGDRIVNVDSMERQMYSIAQQHNLQPLRTDHVKEGESYGIAPRRIQFRNPGTRFSSQKQIANAYTNETRWVDKKDESQRVTERTAGTHLHFSVSTHSRNSAASKKAVNELLFGSSREHTNALVKLLDSQWNDVYGPNSEAFDASAKRRVERYQTLGDYRVKTCGNETEQYTLEYRQLGCTSFGHRLPFFIRTFQYEALQYIRAALA